MCVDSQQTSAQSASSASQNCHFLFCVKQIDLKQKNEADIEQDVLLQGPGVHGEKRAGLSANSQRVTTTNHQVLR